MAAKHNHDFIVMDLETGGMNPRKHPICSIALIVLNNDLEEQEKYSAFIKPYNSELIYTEEAYEVHGLTKEFLEKDGKDIKVVFKEICAIFKKYKHYFYKPILVGHNLSKFDIGGGINNMIPGKNDFLGGFLSYMWEEMFKDNIYNYVENFIFDTLFYAKFCLKDAQENDIDVSDIKLVTLCELFGIQASDAHDASNDVEMNKELFKFFMNYLKGNKDIINKEQKTKARINFHIG
jgi:DNA polymerase III epsilon subunit-like protein